MIRRKTVSVTLEDIGLDSSLDADISCVFTPGEAEVRYMPDGSGYPGSPADVEIHSVTARRWHMGTEVFRRDSADHWKQLDKFAEEFIRERWASEFRGRCLDEFQEQEPEYDG